MRRLGLTTLARGNGDTILLALIGTGECTPEACISIADNIQHIPENSQGASKFHKIGLSGDCFPLYETGYEISNWPNCFIATPYAIFEDSYNTDPNQLELLPYKYELKYDHLSSTIIPDKAIRIFDNNGVEISQQYFKTLIEVSYRVEGLRDDVSGVGHNLGPFIIQRSQVDCAAARAALGENIWGEVFGTTGNEDHLLWEMANQNLLRPPWSTSSEEMGVTSGTLSRIEDGRYTRDEFLEFYVDADGYWGQELSGSNVFYTDNTSAQHILGMALTGELTATPKTIGELISDKYLDDDDGYHANIAYTVTLLLPEFLVHQTGQTFWTQYNKFVRYTLSGEVIQEYVPNYREIINPILLMRNEVDYTILGGEIHVGEEFQGKFGVSDTLYVKKNSDHIISILRPPSIAVENWFLHVTKGSFKIGSDLYQTYRYVSSFGCAPDWFQNASYPCFSDDGNTLMKVVKERAKIIDQRSISVRHIPIFFWSGARNSGDWSADYGYFASDASAVYDTGEYDQPDNPWPRYIPPSLIDYHTAANRRFYPANPLSDPKFSHGISIYRNGTLVSNAEVETWDLWNGIIVFKHVVHPDDVWEVTYLSEMNKAPIPVPNLNPIYPEQSSGEFVSTE